MAKAIAAEATRVQFGKNGELVYVSDENPFPIEIVKSDDFDLESRVATLEEVVGDLLNALEAKGASEPTGSPAKPKAD